MTEQSAAVDKEGAGPASEWRLSFDMTDGDVRTIYAQYFDHMYRVTDHALPRTARRRRWGVIAVLAGVLLAMLVLHASGTYSAPPLLAWAVAIALMGTAAGLVDDRDKRRRQSSRALNSFLTSHQLESLIGPWTVELRPEGVWVESPTQTRLLKWMGIGAFVDQNGIVGVQEPSGSGVCIPHRVFRDADHMRAFLERGEAELAAKGAGFAARVVAYLATADLSCPGCRYSLRGVRELRCPECGREVQWQDVPRAFQRSNSG